MKTKIFNCLIVALCAVSFFACKEKEEPSSVGMPVPSFLEISGIITDEAGSPLNSVVVYADTTNLGITKECLIHGEIFESIKNDGWYGIRYQFWGYLKAEEWPSELSEVTIIAEDTTGIYEKQKKTMPVVVSVRYPEYSPMNYLVDGHVYNADFVMKKK